MTDDMRLRWGLQADQTHATVAIFKGEKILAQIDLPSDSVLQAIHGLGALRQQMVQPDRGAGAPAQMPVTLAANPLWAVRPGTGESGVELVINHPAYGVLAFSLPREEAQKLAEHTLSALDHPAGGARAN
jgi:hypothetical protein